MIADEQILLVDESDMPVGKRDKSSVHRLGLLHRAFSVFIFNSHGELLMQRRAAGKYHSGGLWTNTCCSHPKYGEEVSAAVSRRLKEEMGLTCSTEFVFKFMYRAEMNNGITEHEMDHVYFGITDQAPEPDDSEVSEWKYADMQLLSEDVKLNHCEYTEWFRICFDEVMASYCTHIRTLSNERVNV